MLKKPFGLHNATVFVIHIFPININIDFVINLLFPTDRYIITRLAPL